MARVRVRVKVRVGVRVTARARVRVKVRVRVEDDEHRSCCPSSYRGAMWEIHGRYMGDIVRCRSTALMLSVEL